MDVVEGTTAGRKDWGSDCRRWVAQLLKPGRHDGHGQKCRSTARRFEPLPVFKSKRMLTVYQLFMVISSSSFKLDAAQVAQKLSPKTEHPGGRLVPRLNELYGPEANKGTDWPGVRKIIAPF